MPVLETNGLRVEYDRQGRGRALLLLHSLLTDLTVFDGMASELAATRSVVRINLPGFGASAPVRFVVRRGFLGGNSPEPHVTEHCWAPGNVLVLHSDGVSDKWQFADVSELTKEPAPAMAQAMLAALARDEDDATVLVVRDAAP